MVSELPTKKVIAARNARRSNLDAVIIPPQRVESFGTPVWNQAEISSENPGPRNAATKSSKLVSCRFSYCSAQIVHSYYASVERQDHINVQIKPLDIVVQTEQKWADRRWGRCVCRRGIVRVRLNEDLFFRQVCKQHRVNVTETLHTVNLHCPGPVGHRTGITHGFEYGLTENTRISAEF